MRFNKGIFCTPLETPTPVENKSTLQKILRYYSLSSSLPRKEETELAGEFCKAARAAGWWQKASNKSRLNWHMQ